MKIKGNTIRINIIFILAIVLLFCVIIWKIGYVALNNVVEGKNIRQLADARIITTKTIHSTRGTIYDNQGEPVAENVNSYTMYAILTSKWTTDPDNPKYVVDYKKTAEELSKIFLNNNPESSMTYEYILSRINQQEHSIVLLDEVQYAISPSDVASDKPLPIYGILNGLLNKRNVDVYVTGSNSRFLSSDVRTEFRGRGDEVHVQPLSFAEFMSVYEGDKYEGLRDYMTYGGLPQIVSFKTHEQKTAYLTNLFKETYLKDIIARYNVRSNANELGELVDILASGIGSLTNPRKLSNTFKSVNQIIFYLLK